MGEQSIEQELTVICCPFPTVGADGALRDGISFAQPAVCKKCEGKGCKSLFDARGGDQVRHRVCAKGVSVFALEFGFGVLIANGLVEMFLNRECNAQLRKRLRAQKVTLEAVERWWYSVRAMCQGANTALDNRVNESIHSLHDIGTSVRLVKSFAGRIIQQYPGRSDDEKIEAAPDEMKALYKSVLLLGRRLELSSIVANPEAAGFGQKRPTPVYKIFDLICKLFKEVAHWEGGKHINIYGTSHKTPPVYSSFETLALVLIDNAVKYCDEGAGVNVLVNDTNQGVSVSVENPGILVPEEFRKTIFEKGFRTPSAKSMQAGGRGFGLYIADVIAKIHGFAVQYVALKTGGGPETGRGTNSFKFIVPD
jgi:hypothetical protein